MLLTDYLTNSAKKFANYPALTMRMGYRNVSLTYKEVYTLSKKVALFLEEKNIGKGDKILLLAPNSPYWICLYWGCLLRGAVLVPLSIQCTPDLVEKIAKQTNPKLFFSYAFFQYTIKDIPTFKIELLNELVEPYNEKKFKKTPLLEDDLIQILYTSGTTGLPKGVMLTHKNICSNVKNVTEVVSIMGPEERILSILPLSHIFEQTAGFMIPFSLGSHIIYSHSFMAIRDLLKTYKITRLIAVPEFLKVFMLKIKEGAKRKGKLELLNKLQKISMYFNKRWLASILFRSVRAQFGGNLETIVSGGAPLNPQLEAEWNSFGIDILQGYGLTETSPVVTTNTFDNHREISVGQVIPNVQVKIDKKENILVKGPSVFQGYYKNDEKTREAFDKQGWFITGDLGEFDKNGFLFLKGRKKYMILSSSGQNVYPEDIEQVLNNIECVVDSCVIGLEKSNENVEIHAVLLCKEGKCSGEKIVSIANSKLSSFQQIQSNSVWPGDDFPRSATRKIKKHEVIEFIKKQKENVAISKQPYTKFASLVKILSQLIGVDANKITPDTKLIPTLGLDSLQRIELVLSIEETFKVAIDESLITKDMTLKDLENMILEQKPIKPSPELIGWPRWKLTYMFRTLFQPILFSFIRTFAHLKVKGKKNLNNISGPVIFMPNHLSFLDPIIVTMAIPIKFRYKLAHAAAVDVLYKTYKSISSISEFLFNTFPFPRKEYENIKLGLDYMGKLIDNNNSIVIFPEGKISKTGKLLPFKHGAGLIAIEMGIPIVPVKVVGTNNIVPYEKHFPRKIGKVTVTFGKPLYFKKSDSYVHATKIIEQNFKKI